jgi:hypothetical protein
MFDHIAIRVDTWQNNLGRFEARLPKRAKWLKRLQLAGNLTTVTRTESLDAYNAVKVYDSGDFEDTNVLQDVHFPKMADVYGPPLNRSGRAIRSRMNPKRGYWSAQVEGVFPMVTPFPDLCTFDASGSPVFVFPVTLEDRTYRFSTWVRTSGPLEGQPCCLFITGPDISASPATVAQRAITMMGSTWQQVSFDFSIVTAGAHTLFLLAQGIATPNSLATIWVDDVTVEPVSPFSTLNYTRSLFAGQGDGIARVIFTSNRLREFGQYVLNRKHYDTTFGTATPTDTYFLNASADFILVEGYVERFDIELDTVWILIEYEEKSSKN